MDDEELFTYDNNRRKNCRRRCIKDGIILTDFTKGEAFCLMGLKRVRSSFTCCSNKTKRLFSLSTVNNWRDYIAQVKINRRGDVFHSCILTRNKSSTTDKVALTRFYALTLICLCFPFSRILLIAWK